MAYRLAARQAYNNRRFDELDRIADEARSSKAKFGNGSWKIAQFYDSLGCSDGESEGMWQLHGSIHQAWIEAKPESVTARVARVIYLLEYAWRARGNGYADTVTIPGGLAFENRLKLARQALNDCKAQGAACPGWWFAGLRIALGQGWPRAEYDRFYADAKAFEPTYWIFDTARSRYLSGKWYGQPGEWETQADNASAAPDGLGMETYTRCVLEQWRNYNNVFKETDATWEKTRRGFELMERRYPASLEVPRASCRLACLAGDRATAKRLFARLGDDAYSDVWVTRDYLDRARAWAEAGN